ncbi:MAG: hypothetical protein ACT4OS_10865 [Acidimicrobiales bacterium]
MAGCSGPLSGAEQRSVELDVRSERTTQLSASEIRVTLPPRATRDRARVRLEVQGANDLVLAGAQAQARIYRLSADGGLAKPVEVKVALPPGEVEALTFLAAGPAEGSGPLRPLASRQQGSDLVAQVDASTASPPDPSDSALTLAVFTWQPEVLAELMAQVANRRLGSYQSSGISCGPAQRLGRFAAVTRPAPAGTNPGGSDQSAQLGARCPESGPEGVRFRVFTQGPFGALIDLPAGVRAEPLVEPLVALDRSAESPGQGAPGSETWESEDSGSGAGEKATPGTRVDLDSIGPDPLGRIFSGRGRVPAGGDLALTVTPPARGRTRHQLTSVVTPAFLALELTNDLLGVAGVDTEPALRCMAVGTTVAQDQPGSGLDGSEPGRIEPDSRDPGAPPGSDLGGSDGTAGPVIDAQELLGGIEQCATSSLPVPTAAALVEALGLSAGGPVSEVARRVAEVDGDEQDHVLVVDGGPIYAVSGSGGTVSVIDLDMRGPAAKDPAAISYNVVVDNDGTVSRRIDIDHSAITAIDDLGNLYEDFWVQAARQAAACGRPGLYSGRTRTAATVGAGSHLEVELFLNRVAPPGPCPVPSPAGGDLPRSQVPGQVNVVNVAVPGLGGASPGQPGEVAAVGLVLTRQR